MSSGITWPDVVTTALLVFGCVAVCFIAAWGSRRQS